MTPLEHAISYARQGWPVFPCDPATKKPLTEHGHKDATTDVGTISKWWEAHPGAMIGVPTGPKSGFWVLDMDVDGEKGIDGVGALSTLGMLPETVTQVTPRGGLHALFKWGARRPVRNSTSKIGPGIDVRGDGGYVILAGSVRSDGRAYQWKRAPDRCAIVDAPTWLHEEIERAKRGEDLAKPIANKDHTDRAEPRPAGVLIDHCRRVAETKTGQRNDALNKASFALGRLVGLGQLQQDETEGALRSAAAECGLIADDGEQSVNATIASGLGAGVKELRNQAARRVEQLETKAVAPKNLVTEATLVHLAALSPIEFDRVRADEAERLGVRVSTLDDEVEKLRPSKEVNPGAGRALSLPVPEPWPELVDGAEILNAAECAIADHVKLSREAAVAVALWCVHAHALDAAYFSPRLAITSPEKRCGKTTLLRLIEALTPKPLAAANITAAALFRTIELARPTFLIDEADTYLIDNEELRGIINSGHVRGGQVIRLVGDDHDPRVFSTFCPTAIAAIGAIPGTIDDRSISVLMSRKKKDEAVARFRADRSGGVHDLNRKAARWVADNLDSLRELDPPVPAELHDRAADNWRPLLAIADLAGGDWPARARRAALKLSGADAGEGDTTSTLLLEDIRMLFRERDVDRLKSEGVTTALSTMLDRPWPTFDRGRPISPAGIARLLKPYGITPGTIRIGEETARGYLRSAFEDAFSRYLPP